VKLQFFIIGFLEVSLRLIVPIESKFLEIRKGKSKFEFI